MLKKYFIVLSAGVLLNLSVSASPVYSWDFEQFKQVKSASFRGKRFQNHEKKSSIFRGVIVPDAGVNNSLALGCTGKLAHFTMLPLDWKEFAIEMKFKLTRGLNPGRHTVLFAYTADKKLRRRMVAWIKPRGRIELLYQILSDKNKVERSFSLITPELKWQNNRFYSLRISCVSGKTAEIQLDGKLLASSENAMSLSDLRLDGETHYSVLYFGYYPFYGGISNVLNGFVDDIKLYNKVEIAVERKKDLSDTAEELNPQRHICLDNQWSRPFTVDDLPGKMLGTFVRADEKFWQNAARVRTEIKDKMLVVDFDCPVPAGMKAGVVPGHMWSMRSDRVEFFIQPDPAVNKYFQYVAAADGSTYAGIGPSTENTASRAKFKVTRNSKGYAVTIKVPLSELGIEKLENGSFFRGNFIRTGETCGRSSSWSPTGDNFHSPENFSPILIGSRKAYFEKKFQSVALEFASLKITPALQKDIDAVKNSIAKNGNDPARFNVIEKQLTSLDYSIAQARLAGAKQLIWQPEMWENNMNLSRLAKPLKKIFLRIPRNGRTVVGFAVSNLENSAFLGQIKVFQHWPFKRPNWQYFCYQTEWNKFLSNIKISEGIGSRDNSGKIVYDTLSPLPLNTLLRIPAKTTAPLWLEISAKGLEPGKYTGYIVLKNCGGKGGFESAKLEVEVSSADIEEVDMDQSVYTAMMRRSWHHESFRKFFAKYNYNYHVLLPGFINLSVYWKKGQGNTLIPGKLDDFGKYIDSAIASGHDVKKMKFLLLLGWNAGYGGKPDTELWEKIMTASIPAWLNYLEKKYGIPNANIVFNPIDEPNGNIDDPKSSLGKVLRWSKFIKKIAPKAKVMNNPLYATKSDAFKKLAPVTDIFMLYRPEVENNPAFIKYMQSLMRQGKEIWTYNILQKSQQPDTYRLDYWRNCRDGFNSVTTFWDLEDHAGGDGFDPGDVTNPTGRIKRTDYGMAYVDFNYGTILVGRRFEAAQRGYQDMRIAALCRKRIASLKSKGVNTSEFEKQLNDAVLKGIRGSMADMDEQSDVILVLAEKLIKLDNLKK